MSQNLFRNTICAVHDKFQAGISQKRSWSFSRNLWPQICKKSQKTGYLRKNFFSLETTQNALKFVRNTSCAVHDKFPVGISQKRRWSFFKKSVTPDMQKKSKNFKFLKNFFFARNDPKRLKIRSQHHLCSPRQISGRYLSKKTLVIFQFQIFEKIFFRLKQPKAPSNSFATPFVQSTKNFRPVSLKKEVGHFSRNLWPLLCKKDKKSRIFKKIFFRSKQPKAP